MCTGTSYFKLFLRSLFRDPQRPSLDNGMLSPDPQPILLCQLVHPDILQENAKRLFEVTEHRIAGRDPYHFRASHYTRATGHHGHECHRRYRYEFLHQ